MPQISQDLPTDRLSLNWQYGSEAMPQRRFPTNLPSEPAGVAFARGDRVLHAQWGLGRVLGTTSGSPIQVTVQWQDAVRSVSTLELRRLLPRTLVAEMIEKATPDVTSWMFRKADRQGRIQPDAAGKFAGHTVRYYDPERIPSIVDTLSRQDCWSIDSLVLHSRYGAGRILDGRPENTSRLVYFFSQPAPISVSVQDLRHLIPGSVVARRINVNRKTFAKLALRHGIRPDFTNEGCGRDFYDEGRIDAIRNRWFAPEPATPLPVGTPVMDRVGDIAKVEFLQPDGKVRLRYLRPEGLVQDLEPVFLRKLVSVRELARTERMSRYKLQRLLAAAGVKAIFQHGHTIYFELSTAREAVRARLAREHSAIDLRVLSQRTGVSAEVLARKVRHGCIRTTGQTAHMVDGQEAERIARLVTALRSRHEGAPALGICRFHVRGRAGQEVASWDVAQLVDASSAMSPDKRAVLFDQVGWLCEGAGAKRLREALSGYLGSLHVLAEEGQDVRRKAEILSMLVDALPGNFSHYRYRLLLLLSGVMERPCCGADRLRALARDAGALSEEGYRQFGLRMEESFAALLETECWTGVAERQANGRSRSASAYPDDQFVPGAVIVALNDRKPDVGVIAKVEQQAWNAMAGIWDKTLVVRFSTGERRINPYTRKRPVRPSTRAASVLLLLERGRAASLFADLARGKFHPEAA